MEQAKNCVAFSPIVERITRNPDFISAFKVFSFGGGSGGLKTCAESPPGVRITNAFEVCVVSDIICQAKLGAFQMQQKRNLQ